MRVARHVAAALIAAVPTLAGASELRIASWNIVNLASEPGKELRGFVRTEKDYVQLADQIRLLRPDIIALQEIGSIPGAQRALGDGWRVTFESRCLNNPHKCMADNDEIYTAIAFREELTERVSVFQVDALGIDHTDECGLTRPIRGGVGVKLEIGGQPTWVLSVHMKATCKDNNVEPGTEDDCATQRRQYDILKSWIEARPSGDAVIIAGDLNRHLLTPNDRIRRDIFESLRAKVQFLPELPFRTCWRTHHFDFPALRDEARRNNPAFDAQGLTPNIFTPIHNAAIDFFVVINAGPQMRFASDQMETDALYRFEKPGETLKKCDGTILASGNEALTFGQAYPSDHCPILLSIGF